MPVKIRARGGRERARDPRRRARPGPGPCGPGAHRVGRAQHAGAAGHPRPLQPREAAQGPARGRLPARHHRDGQPDAHAQGRRRRGVPVRLEPAQHPGRRGRGAGRRLRHLDLRHQGRGPQDLLLAHRLVHRGAAAHHHGRRLRPGDGAAHQEARLPEGRAGRHRGDLDRRDAPAGHGRRQDPALPGRRHQRRRDQALLRQPLRHRPEHDGRHHPQHQPAHRRLDRGHRRLRLVRPRRGHARQGPGRPRCW